MENKEELGTTTNELKERLEIDLEAQKEQEEKINVIFISIENSLYI